MNITSEILPLKKVLVHRPGLDLERLTPDNCHQFLFDDVLWPDKAVQEHNEFTNVLRNHGVEVIYIEDLLEDVVNNQAVRHELLDHVLGFNRYLGTDLEHVLRDYFHSLSAKECVEKIVGGLTFAMIDHSDDNLLIQVAKNNDFILPPLPNHLYARDASCWIADGISINPMHSKTRRGETNNMAMIYKHHPLFSHYKKHIWYDGSLNRSLPNLEGGDVLVISENCVLIGISQRTQPEAVELLSKTLFTHTAVNKVIGIELPNKRTYMHLDT